MTSLSPHDDELTIRPARVDDAAAIGRLWLEARPEFCPAFGVTAELARAALGRLWTDREHLAEVGVAEVGGRVVGMAVLTRYPGRDPLRRLRERRTLARAFGWRPAARGMRRLAALGWERGVWPDELYLNALAVLPCWRRRGLGRVLVEWADQETRLAALEVMVAHAPLANRAAREALARLGFVEGQVCPPTRWARRALGHVGLITLRKRLTASPDKSLPGAA